MADARKVVEQLVDAMNDHDLDRYRELFGPDCRCVTATGRIIDPDALAGVLAHTLAAFPDMQISVDRWVVDGDVVVTEEVLDGTHRQPWAGLAPTGRRVRIPMLHLSRVADDRIVERVGYHDSAAIIRQLEA